MSRAHKDEFERIKREYEAVVAHLASLVKKRQKGHTSRSPLFDPDLLEAAIATANDAYALLMILMGIIKGKLASLLRWEI